MPKTIFINLPVSDLRRSIAFYEAIGCTRNDAFSNDRAAMLSWSDSIGFMLMTHDMLRTFTTKSIADPSTATLGHYALALDSREDVDRIAAAALAAGGRELHGAEDEGFMYSRAFEDPDGHAFGPFWMDAAAATAPQAEAA
ncbi:lactoylglutathione lyase [Sphingomonas sp. ID1715]|uniref:VOC family protein n=1 Tax=Sphingomonas sp. ID1715 TaxID=1656898 RepID=UPI001489D1A5|nr:VOC family protein [Sphingomonas sp. ID1715]NNM78674.1 lactoylglutathione lyase [Sphingomonas sp. ID1715]